MTLLYFEAAALTAAAERLFVAAGSPPAEGARVARLLVAADLAGHESHGVARASQYLRNLRRGRLHAGRDVTVLRDHGAALRLSGNWGYGQTSAAQATELGIERARAHGVAAVGVSDMNHCGRLSDYAAQGAQAGLVALVFGASSGFNALMAPFGGSERRMNTNPLAAAFPSQREQPLVFDIATSAGSQGRIKLLLESGQPVPEGVLVDSDGRPTTDPAQLYQGGALLPFGGKQGYKAYLLNFLVEVLGGILTDGGFMGQPKREAGGQCLLLILLDVARFRALPDFEQELDALIAYLKSSRTAPGGEVLAPGEASARKTAARLHSGIPVPAATLQSMQEELDHYGLGISLAALGRDTPLGAA